MNADVETSVYRYFDEHGTLLYVGITARNLQRNDEHTNKEWWGFVATQSVEHHESRPLAAHREKALIQLECPPFNKVHNPHHADLRVAYLRSRAMGAPPKTKGQVIQEFQDPIDLYRTLGRRLPLSVQIQTQDRLSFVTEPTHISLAKILLLPPPKETLASATNGQRFGWVKTLKVTPFGTALLVEADKPIPEIGRAYAEVQLKCSAGGPVAYIKFIRVDRPRARRRRAA